MNAQSRAVMVVNTDFVAGYEIVEMLGLVRGNTARMRHISRDIFAKMKQILTGGEIVSYTEMMAASRDEALSRMVAEAQALNADAVINLRFITSSLMDTASEVMAYGTAVRVRPLPPAPEGQRYVRPAGEG